MLLGTALALGLTEEEKERLAYVAFIVEVESSRACSNANPKNGEEPLSLRKRLTLSLRLLLTTLPLRRNLRRAFVVDASTVDKAVHLWH